MAFSQTRRKGRHVWCDCSPSCLYSRKPPLFRAHVLQNCDIYAEKYTQAALEDMSTRTSRSSRRICMVQSFDEVTLPASIADFPPPVIPEFGNVRSLVRDGAQLLQYVKTSSGGTFGGNSSDARGNSGDYGRVAPNASSPRNSPAAREAGLLTYAGIFWRVSTNTLRRSVPSPTDVWTVVAAVLEAALTAPAVGRTPAAGEAVPVEVPPPSSCAAESLHLPTNRDAGSTICWG